MKLRVAPSCLLALVLLLASAAPASSQFGTTYNGLSKKEYFSRTYVDVGKANARDGYYQAAVDNFKKALEYKPTMAEAYYEMGRAYSKLNNPAAALSAFQSAATYCDARKQPVERFMATFMVGNTLVQLKRLDEALSAFQASSQMVVPAGSKVDPVAESRGAMARTWHLIGLQDAMDGNLGRAVECFKKGLTYEPNMPELKAALARAEESLKPRPPPPPPPPMPATPKSVSSNKTLTPNDCVMIGTMLSVAAHTSNHLAGGGVEVATFKRQIGPQIEAAIAKLKEFSTPDFSKDLKSLELVRVNLAGSASARDKYAELIFKLLQASLLDDMESAGKGYNWYGMMGVLLGNIDVAPLQFSAADVARAQSEAVLKIVEYAKHAPPDVLPPFMGAIRAMGPSGGRQLTAADQSLIADARHYLGSGMWQWSKDPYAIGKHDYALNNDTYTALREGIKPAPVPVVAAPPQDNKAYLDNLGKKFAEIGAAIAAAPPAPVPAASKVPANLRVRLDDCVMIGAMLSVAGHTSKHLAGGRVSTAQFQKLIGPQIAAVIAKLKEYPALDFDASFYPLEVVRKDLAQQAEGRDQYAGIIAGTASEYLLNDLNKVSPAYKWYATMGMLLGDIDSSTLQFADVEIATARRTAIAKIAEHVKSAPPDAPPAFMGAVRAMGAFADQAAIADARSYLASGIWQSSSDPYPPAKREYSDGYVKATAAVAPPSTNAAWLASHPPKP